MKILRFWGITINKIFSEDDVVENIRKNLKRSKKYVWFHIAMLILICLCFPMLWDAVMFTTKQIPEKDRMMSWLGMIIGFSTGIFIAQYVMIAGLTILMALDVFDYE